ncbi:hypothetical protein BCR32DRAFT_277778 [Anaeromyces robustus]|uniref:Uncharacterized protein n=1 Tax=Anaeromyces robustus TaxID=1754192 RepID=A0A1Y1XD98_9FUNG|nr:hypothetical protein BCR32DRAFT_277778 [Anaeromyces robustus]|eukprot:ORX83703.1 hypothetical protein BCR32DRAFT_277778 [Anaeromyces robustus]
MYHIFYVLSHECIRIKIRFHALTKFGIEVLSMFIYTLYLVFKTSNTKLNNESSLQVPYTNSNSGYQKGNHSIIEDNENDNKNNIDKDNEKDK